MYATVLPPFVIVNLFVLDCQLSLRQANETCFGLEALIRFNHAISCGYGVNAGNQANRQGILPRHTLPAVHRIHKCNCVHPVRIHPDWHHRTCKTRSTPRIRWHA